MGSDMANRTGLLSYFSLFTSFGTLLCCALPSLLVLLGLGATVASVLSSAPWLVTLSRHKDLVFAISGALIGMNFFYVYALAPRLQARGAACPVDSPDACAGASRMSRVVLWISGILYGAGFLSAYVLGPFLLRFAS